MKRKKKQWTKFRHRVIRNIAYAVLYPYIRIKYGARIEKFREKEKRQYLIAFNHQTAADQFIVGSAFKGAVYYVASEDILTNGFISRLLSWAVAPIPIKKQATDVGAVLNCKRVAKEGGTIALAPEGNRTYSGKTGYIKPAIVAFVRTLKLPLVLYRIEGGYGVHPRWSDEIRKGHVRGYVSRVVERSEYEKLTDEELLALIQKELYVDESQPVESFTGKNLAQYLERALYVCPKCGLSTLRTEKDEITCTKCGETVRYLPNGRLQGENFPFTTVAEWYENQCDFINGLDLNAFSEAPLYQDQGLRISSVQPYKRKTHLDKNGEALLYKDKIELTIAGEKTTLTFEKIDVATVLGRNKLNLYHEGKVYQIKGDKRFNALKYVNLCYRYKNAGKEGEDGKFLGL